MTLPGFQHYPLDLNQTTKESNVTTPASDVDYSVPAQLENTEQVGDCLLWKGSLRGQMGYPQFSHKVGTGSRSGHREVYIYYNADIPKGFDVGHMCDNPRCINPEHLVLQTRQQNIRQMVEHGRHVCGYKLYREKYGNDGK
jgi:hypothetical protein